MTFFFFINTVPKTAVFKKKEKKKEILQGAVDTAGFMKQKKKYPCCFLSVWHERFIWWKKKVAVQRLRNTDRGWSSFSAGICQGIPTHLETPKRLHTQSNTCTLQVYRVALQFFSKSHQNPGSYFTFFLAIILKNRSFLWFLFPLLLHCFCKKKRLAGFWPKRNKRGNARRRRVRHLSGISIELAR